MEKELEAKTLENAQVLLNPSLPYESETPDTSVQPQLVNWKAIHTMPCVNGLGMPLAEAMAKLLRENQELTQDLEFNKEVTHSAAHCLLNMPLTMPHLFAPTQAGAPWVLRACMSSSLTVDYVLCQILIGTS